MTARSTDLIRKILSDLIRAVIDRPYMLNIQGFGCPAPIPTPTPNPFPTVGSVYDCTFLIPIELNLRESPAASDTMRG